MNVDQRDWTAGGVSAAGKEDEVAVGARLSIEVEQGTDAVDGRATNDALRAVGIDIYAYGIVACLAADPGLAAKRCDVDLIVARAGGKHREAGMR